MRPGLGICMHAQDEGMKQARNGDMLCNTCFRLVVALRVSNHDMGCRCWFVVCLCVVCHVSVGTGTKP